MTRFAIVPECVLADPRLDTYEKMLLVTLLLHAGKEGTCFPSIATIAKLSGMGRRTTFRKLRKLEELGYVSRSKKGTNCGDWLNSMYTLSRELLQKTVGSVREAQGSATTARGSAREAQGVVSQWHTNNTIYNNINNSTNEQKETHEEYRSSEGEVLLDFPQGDASPEKTGERTRRGNRLREIIPVQRKSLRKK